MNFLSAAALLLVVEGVSVQRPLVDFDLVVDALKTQGTWEENKTTKFLYRPKVEKDWAPYRNGQWIYTDYGWTWKGADAGSWVTYHYGYWTKRVADGWVWVPSGHWLPSTVDWVKSGDYVGWRASKLDRFSNTQEPDNVRYSDPSEWNFVLSEKLRGPLKPEDFVTGEKAKDLLISGQPLDHIFKSYREIGRPGPDPAILKSGEKDKLLIPIVRDLQDLESRPDKAEATDFYAYRPSFAQDEDGILRRVELFLHPRKQSEKDEELKKVLGHDPKKDEDAKKQAEKLEEQIERERKNQEMLYR
ncbi:MAG: hypothetical protein PHD76_09055 [Methylacidiphilales bacterium]|nr:hypothetical protein [Candidatus Methylacidiphilales bacterium]